MAVYLDCNATTPVDPRVQQEVLRYLAEEYGNAGSRTHERGARAKRAVERAREQVAAVVDARPDEVVFTSGATESNNLALLGLATYGEESSRRHVVSSQIEHKAVLEPLEALRRRGFEVTLVPPTHGGWVEADRIAKAVRGDTLVVSVMHVNNETGVVQPIAEIAERLASHPAFFHVDAAQGFGKDLAPLRSKRVDLVSVSGHKIYGPKGIGALLVRRRGVERVPLHPLLHGGGQERGLRPGTLPVPLVVGLGLAAELAVNENRKRLAACEAYRCRALAALTSLGAILNSDPERTLPHVANVSIPGLDSEAVMVALKGVVEVSNGSACTSQSYEPSHVLTAMGLDRNRVSGALRFSWFHGSEDTDWGEATRRVRRLL
jgi:cysteine desulfurase